MLQKLAAFSREMARHHSINHLATCIVDMVLDCCEAQTGFLAIPAADGVIDRRVGRDQNGHDLDWPTDEGLNQAVDSVLHDWQPVELQGLATGPTVVLPLVSSGVLVGALVVGDMCCADGLHLARVLAGQAAIALDNLQLRAQQDEDQDRAYTGDGAEIAPTTTLLESMRGEFVSQMLCQLANLVAFECARISLVEGDRLHLVGTRVQTDAGSESRLTLSCDKIVTAYHYVDIPLFYTVLQSGQALIISNTNDDPLWQDVPPLPITVGGWMGIPLITAGIVVGLMEIGRQQPYTFTPHDLELATSTARQLMVVVGKSCVGQQSDAEVAEGRMPSLPLMRMARLAVAGEIASGVAHHIHNPLTSIIAQAFLLLKRLPPDDPAYQSVETIRLAAYRASTVVQRMLDLSDPAPYEMELLDINQSLHYVVSLLRPQLEPDVAVVLDLAPDLPFVQGSEHHIDEVWINLLLNAREAIEGVAEGAITIATRLAMTGTAIEVSVHDNGVGIPAGDLDRIFTPFFTTKSNGAGLGLTICQDILLQHGGSLSVCSDEEQGTRFSAVLPVNPGRVGQ
ncbi:MAG: GAF domain-containing protein [Chloroflexi bacterium]|nr:GAF domain-containing protein [Chloroflexota bacterium]